MIGRPAPTEYAPYYANYISQAPGDDPLTLLEAGLVETPKFYAAISDQKSLQRYAPDKWSLRELLNHVNDAERVFAYRALWFARGYTDALPTFDQNVAVISSLADHVAWPQHIVEFRAVRAATLTLFKNLPDEAWLLSGIASNYRVSVRALAWIIAGHAAHHQRVAREKYLSPTH
jgi:DinB superfamily